MMSRTVPRPFLTAAEKLGVEIDDCIVVGDSVWNLSPPAELTPSEWAFWREVMD